MNTLRIFIVEDDPIYAKILSHHLMHNPDYDVEVFANGKSFLDNLYRNPDIVSLDYSLPDFTGMDLLKRISSFRDDLPVVIISGQEDINTAISLLKEGASDYIVKANDTKERLWNSVRIIKEKIELKNEIKVLRREISEKYVFTNIITGRSSAMKTVFALMEKAASSNITVSISGETGTGKELVAKAIHHHSNYRNGRFVAINVSAIPKELIESELFGHQKGSFTGAVATRIGKFEEAHKGTIFLDEIAEMDINMQTKLLRVLQEKELSRVGANEIIKFDARVIVATHKNLFEEVKMGNFREDLYYRLLGLPIELPPLRERGNDILVIAKHFITEYSKENNVEQIELSTEAQEKLMLYPWPGNVRELKAVIELAAVLSADGLIGGNEIRFQSGKNFTDFLKEERTLEEYTNLIIKYYLEKYDDNLLEVSRRLKIGKSTLYRKRNCGEI